MTFFELDACLEIYLQDYRDTMERMRMICYFIAQSNSTECMNKFEMMPFTWDKQDDENKRKAITQADRDRIAARIKEFEKNQ
jgi:hypothetical protein